MSGSPLLASNRKGIARWIGWRRQKQREWRRKNALSVFSFALCLQISASPQSLSDILCAQPRTRLAVKRVFDRKKKQTSEPNVKRIYIHIHNECMYIIYISKSSRIVVVRVCPDKSITII